MNESVNEIGKKFAAQNETLEKKQIAPASNSNPLSVNPQSVNPMSVKSLDEPKSHDVDQSGHGVTPSDQYNTAMKNFLSVSHNIESNLVRNS